MSLILLFHIVIATSLTLAVVALLIAAIRFRQAAVAYSYTKFSFIATLLSGIVLIGISPKGIGHFCIQMTIYSLATFAVRSFYLRRMNSPSSATETTL